MHVFKLFQEENRLETEKKLISGDLALITDRTDTIEKMMIKDMSDNEFTEMHAVASNTGTDGEVKVQHASKLQGVGEIFLYNTIVNDFKIFFLF